MKKACLLTVVTFLGSYAVSQSYGSGTYPGSDKLGAHQNGGRGCAGCHSPHSGVLVQGGNASNAKAADNTSAGASALWGQDLGPLYGYVLNQGDSVPGKSRRTLQTVLPASSQFTSAPEEISGIMTCLSCHDGNIAKSAMMTNKSYEQAAGLLPAAVYGPNAIPTLLGNDGTTSGNYYNDHPVGPQATLGAVGVASNFVYTSGGCTSNGIPHDCLKIAGSASDYQAFANHYGAPNIISYGHGSPVALPDTNPANAYLLCTTCHDPHSMNTVEASPDAPIAGHVKGTYATYFFVAAPYNPGAKPRSSQTSSTTQFCRQCHFGGTDGANEASGIMTITTAF